MSSRPAEIPCGFGQSHCCRQPVRWPTSPWKCCRRSSAAAQLGARKPACSAYSIRTAICGRPLWKWKYQVMSTPVAGSARSCTNAANSPRRSRCTKRGCGESSSTIRPCCSDWPKPTSRGATLHRHARRWSASYCTTRISSPPTRIYCMRAPSKPRMRLMRRSANMPPWRRDIPARKRDCVMHSC